MEQSRFRLVVVIALSAVTLLGVLAAAVTLRGDHRAVPRHDLPVVVAESRIVVEVLNGTDRRGLARAATRLLRHRGLDVVYFGTTDGGADSTHVFVRRGSERNGALAVTALGVGRVVVARDSTLRVDLTIVLGADFQPPIDRHP